MVNVTVGGSWLVEEKIGEGSFGEVFRARHNVTGKEYAIKREQVDVPHPQLPHEVDMLHVLKAYDYVPKCHWFGQEGVYNACVLDLLGPNLKQVRTAFGKLPVPFVSEVALQLVTIMESIHRHGIVYRDVKPENFLLEREFQLPVIPNITAYDSDEEKATLKLSDRKILFQRKHTAYIVDFGLATYYRNPETGQHISGRQHMKHKTGTARYASLNVHKGKVHSRRDDMESLGYLFVDLLKGSLPWAGIQARTSRQGWAKMKEMKEDISLEELCEHIPRGFMMYLDYARGLRFEEEPNYKFLKNLLAETVKSGPEAEIVAISNEPLFVDETYEHPLSPPQSTIAAQSSFSPRNHRVNDDHEDDLHVGSPPPSPFYKRGKNSSWRAKNREEIPGFGSSRSNSLTISSRTNSATPTRGPFSPPRALSLPYSDKSPVNGNQTNGRDQEKRAKRPDNQQSHWELKKESKWNDKQQTDPEAWRAGLSWENLNSQEVDSVPTTPVHEHSFWNDNAEFEWRAFDGNQGSDGWISHPKDEHQSKAEVAEWEDGKAKVSWPDQKIPNHIEMTDAQRSRSLSQKASKEWRDLQTRRPSVPSPLSIAIPPRSELSVAVGDNTPTTSRAISPNPQDMTDRNRESAGADENIYLGPRRSIPNIRSNSLLSSKLLKRSVPNLRDAARHHTVPPPAHIQRTMAHIHDLDSQAQTSQPNKKGMINNGNTSQQRRDEKEIIQTEKNNSPRFSPPQDARYSLRPQLETRFSSQDARFSTSPNGQTSPSNGRHRERANTISYNQSLPTQDARYLPSPPTLSARQNGRFNRERSHTFTSPSDQSSWFNYSQQKLQTGAMGHRPDSPSGMAHMTDSPPKSSGGIQHRERSNTFTSGNRPKENSKNGYDRHRPPPLQSTLRVHPHEPQNRLTLNNTNGDQSSCSQFDHNDMARSRAKSVSPSHGHRRRNSVEYGSSRQTSPPSGQTSINTTKKLSTSPQKMATTPVSILSPTSQHFSNTANRREANDAIKSPHHVTFAEKTKVSMLNPSNMSYRRQSFQGPIGHEKNFRTRSFTMNSERERNKAWA
jgi:serine/threonine protein kinase